MISYNSLNKTTNQVLYKIFLNAFSDYQVKIELPFRKFEQMLERRGYNPDLSIGAFYNNNLIGFALNGLRSWNEKVTAYDIATGVIPEYRRQGITSSIFSQVKNLLKEKHVEQYMLEVIKSNIPAVELYQKQGFKIQREFSCYQLEKALLIPTETCKVEEVKAIDYEQVQTFWDYQPSWQNSVDSINSSHKDFTFLVVKTENIIISYGIFDKATGDIPQIAVHKDYRGKGIASSMIAKMIKTAETKKIGIQNIEANQKATENFLDKLGFRHYITQFEMLLKL